MYNQETPRYEARTKDLRLRKPIVLPLQYGAPRSSNQETQDPASALVAGLASLNKALFKYLEVVRSETPAPVSFDSPGYVQGMQEVEARREQANRGVTASIVDMASKRATADFNAELADKLAGAKLGIKEDRVILPWLGFVGRNGSTL